MKIIKSIFFVSFFATTSLVFCQTTQATFANDAAVWKQVGDQFVSEFTVVANQSNLNIIKQNYDGLGSSVTYSVKNSTGDNHTIEMKFSNDTHKSYLYKMLSFIGCETVVVGTILMNINDFSAMLNQ